MAEEETKVEEENTEEKTEDKAVGGGDAAKGRGNEEGEKVGEVQTATAAALERMVKREDWGAVAPVGTEDLVTPVSNIICTYTGTGTCSSQEECVNILKEIQQNHMEEQKMTDILYNFVIGGDGKIYEGRGWTTYAPPALKGKRYSGLDRKSINVAMIGDYKDADPPENMHMARKDLIDYGKEQNFIDPSTAAMWHGF